METVRISSLAAIILSTITIVTCVIFVPMLYAEISAVWQEIDEEIAEFKVGPDTRQFAWQSLQRLYFNVGTMQFAY